jgi:SAM-dependent methyltransferase
VNLGSLTRSLRKKLTSSLGLWVQRTPPGVNPYRDLPAWAYQEKLVSPHVRPGDVVLDIGSGNFPSARANLLADFFPDYTFHRSGSIVESKPVIVCSVERMPFRTGALDFVICSHVLEHVDSPVRAGRELSRVARAGYLETPAYGKDTLVGSGYIHRWQVVEFEGTMHFFQYSPRQTEANVTSPMMQIWTNEQFHPWQQFFWERQDVFNAWVVWKTSLQIVEYRRGDPTPLVQWDRVDEKVLPSMPANLTPEEIKLLERCLATPDGSEPMRFESDRFTNASGSVVYPVRGKRVYCEVGTGGGWDH